MVRIGQHFSEGEDSRDGAKFAFPVCKRFVEYSRLAEEYYSAGGAGGQASKSYLKARESSDGVACGSDRLIWQGG